MKFNTFAIQPTSLCNLNCSYCYVPNRKDSKIMSREVLEFAIKEILTSTFVENDVTLIYHSGEPLLAGLDFFKNNTELINQYNVFNRDVKISIQTNGTLLTDEWCEFFKVNNYNIGISLDGPKFINDKNRYSWNGSSSFDKTLRGIKLLERHEIILNAICVLTVESLKYPNEIFNFFASNNIKHLGFNIDEITNENKKSSFLTKNLDNLKDIERDYIDFFSTIFELKKLSKNIIVREFEQAIDIIKFKLDDATFVPQNSVSANGGSLTIQKDGTLICNCPEFAGSESVKYKNFAVGNISANNFADILLDRNYLLIQEDIQKGLDNCSKSCEYFDLCGGGYPSNKYFENGSLSSTETVQCKLHTKSFFDLMLNKFQRLD